MAKMANIGHGQNAMALPVCCHKQAMRADGQRRSRAFHKRAALQDCKLLHNAANVTGGTRVTDPNILADRRLIRRKLELLAHP
jgi:hypothetical protein